MNSILVGAAVGFFVSLLGTAAAVRLFKAWGWAQRIREDSPLGHLEKVGTPTVGGVAILGGMVAGYIAPHLVFGGGFTARGLAVLGLAVGLGAIGAADDLLKIRRRRSLGLGKWAKLALQALVATLFTVVAVYVADISPDLTFVRDTGLYLGAFFFLWVFVMVAASANGVNLTDGLDGLASGSSALVCAAYLVIAFWQFRHACAIPGLGRECYDIGLDESLDLAIVAASSMGAVAAFLWWNAPPAKIFMGDTGALALGGLFAGLAVMTDTQLLLLVLGGLFAMVTTSVIIQIIAYRVFHTRAFKMAPIHHHFELSGWPEFTVIVRFWIIAGLAVAFGLGLFYADFLARGGGGG